jgi:Branched-chain amino acid transport protein (AzlD)
MTAPIIWLDGPWWPYLALLVFAVLPTEIWRWSAVLFARRLDENSATLIWVKFVATALLAGVVAKLVVSPSGALAALPLLLRLAALVAGLAVLATGRTRVLSAVILGEVVLIGGGWWLAQG